MNIDPDYLAYLRSLERVDSVEERRAGLLDFAREHLTEANMEKLESIEDLEALYKEVYELYTRGTSD